MRRLDKRLPSNTVASFPLVHADGRDLTPNNESLSFRGATSRIGNYLNMPGAGADGVDVADRDRFTFSGPFTFMGLFERKTFTSDIVQRMFGKYSYITSKYEYEMFRRVSGGSPNGQVEVYIYSGSSGSVYIRRYTTSALLATVNEEHSVGFSYDGSMSNTGISIFYDGIEVASAGVDVGTFASISNTTQNLSLASVGADTYPRMWPGKARQLHMFQKHMNSQQMYALHKAIKDQ